MSICKVKGCELNYIARGYCNKHYRQIMKYGIIQKVNKNTPNIIILKENYAEVILKDINNKEVRRAIVDLNNVNLINKYKWYVGNCGYARTSINGKIVRMHRLLIGLENKFQIDHKNRVKLDNRILNLRESDHSINGFNKKIIKLGSSGVVGVRLTKQGKFSSRITKNNEEFYLGTFENKQDAINVRRKAELKFFGELK